MPPESERTRRRSQCDAQLAVETAVGDEPYVSIHFLGAETSAT